MLLKAVYKTKEEIPQGFESLFKEVGGQWEIQVEGMKSQADVDRVMEGLRKERSDHAETRALLHKFDGYSLDDIRKLEDDNALLRADGKGTDIDEKVKALVEAKTASLRRDLAAAEKRANDAEAALKTTKGELVKDKIEVAVVNVASSKVRPEALTDVKLHAAGDFELDDKGNVVTKETCPQGAGLTVEQWLEAKVKNAPHWEIPNKGGGGRGGDGGGGGAPNPWSKKHWNVTKQHEISAADPDKAKRLKADAEKEG